MTGSLTILTWPDYIAPGTLAQFQDETAIMVRLEIVPSAVELVARMQADSPGIDVLCPPDYAVRELSFQGRLLPLDPTRLPNLQHLDPSFRISREHDPQDRVSVPKDWGTTGYLVRQDRITVRRDSWAEFWRLAEVHSGRTTVLDSPGEVLGAALKLRGHSYNAVDRRSLALAEADLRALRPHLLGFETDYKPLLTSGDAWIALGWNGDAAVLQQAGVPIRYVLPEEGSQIWEDDWAIAAGSAHQAEAYTFLDFVLRPQIAANEALYTGYATPNAVALDLLPTEVRSDLAIYPRAEIRARLEPGLPLSPDGNDLRSQIWHRIRGG